MLTQTFYKPYEKIFTEFMDSKTLNKVEKSVDGFSGDVKYHLGTFYRKHFAKFDHTIKLSIPPNPSHLETVNPVLYGTTRSIQELT